MHLYKYAFAIALSSMGFRKSEASRQAEGREAGRIEAPGGVHGGVQEEV